MKWLYDYVRSCEICFFKQKTEYEMRISDWSSDVCFRSQAKRDAMLDFTYGPQPGLGVQQVHASDLIVRAEVAPVRSFRALFPARGIHAIGSASCRERVCQYV